MMVENNPLLIYGLLKIMVDLVNYLVENTPLVLHGLLGMMIVSVEITPLVIYDWGFYGRSELSNMSIFKFLTD